MDTLILYWVIWSAVYLSSSWWMQWGRHLVAESGSTSASPSGSASAAGSDWWYAVLSGDISLSGIGVQDLELIQTWASEVCASDPSLSDCDSSVPVTWTLTDFTKSRNGAHKSPRWIQSSETKRKWPPPPEGDRRCSLVTTSCLLSRKELTSHCVSWNQYVYNCVFFPRSRIQNVEKRDPG